MSGDLTPGQLRELAGRLDDLQVLDAAWATRQAAVIVALAAQLQAELAGVWSWLERDAAGATPIDGLEDRLRAWRGHGSVLDDVTDQGNRARFEWWIRDLDGVLRAAPHLDPVAGTLHATGSPGGAAALGEPPPEPRRRPDVAGRPVGGDPTRATNERGRLDQATRDALVTLVRFRARTLDLLATDPTQLEPVDRLLLIEEHGDKAIDCATQLSRLLEVLAADGGPLETAGLHERAAQVRILPTMVTVARAATRSKGTAPG